MVKKTVVLWKKGPGEGQIEVHRGKLVGGSFEGAAGEFAQGGFSCDSIEPCRLVLVIDADNLGPGARATRVSVQACPGSFTFLLRDVRKESPILIPSYQVAVTEGDDSRSFAEIEAEVRGRGLLTNLQRISIEPEESYEEAVRNTRAVEQSIVLGVSRDIRIFAAGLRGQPRCQINRSNDGTHGTTEVFDWIQPLFHGYDVPLEGIKERSGYYTFYVGRGWGCTHKLSRRLEDGVLPVLRAEIVDDDVRYDCTLFAALEESGLSDASVRGTHWLVADRFSPGHVFTAEQEQAAESLLAQELNRGEETVACFRAVAVNTASVPRYAFFKALSPAADKDVEVPPHAFEPEQGWGMWKETGRVFSVSRLNGEPLGQEETAVLLGPGETAAFEFFLPHRPIPRARARRLSQLDFGSRLEECREFWSQKLAQGGRIELPERRIDEQVKAGALHLDLVAFGLEPEGTLVPTIGLLPAFGTESAPIIRFLDSLGWHDVARRSLSFFLEKQHADGFMQNYGAVEVEPGCVLWLLGEHYRHTRDDGWVAQIAPKVLQSCEYILNGLQRARREEFRGRGFGMLTGPVMDELDPERYFMNSGYAYLGLSRAAEMLARSEPEQSERLAGEAEAVKRDIRTALFEALAEGPVVPLGDGNWSPAAGPWAGYPGPLCLFAEGGNSYSHMAFTLRDSLHGPLYLVFQEVIAPDEEAVQSLLDYHSELMCTRNVALSQPFYSRHDLVHLKRGEVKPFLKAYYNGLAGLADRETYTFTETFFPNHKPHKTHEEAWFLMQTRWMLYMEEGDTLRLLPGIPRAWLESGKRIKLEKVGSYFGPLSLYVESNLDQGGIKASVACPSDRPPRCVQIRLPHPLGRKPISVKGGIYDAQKEMVTIVDFDGRGDVELDF